MNRFFIDIDIDLSLNDKIKQFVANHGRTAFGIMGCMRYIFDDQCLADSFISLLNIDNILFRAYCRVAGSLVLRPYPDACEIMQAPDLLFKTTCK